MSDKMAISDDMQLLKKLALEAGEIGLSYFKSQNKVRYKEGNSPVSEADDAIDDHLKNGFSQARPDYGWLSEETDDDPSRLDKRRVVIVDPIDGTRGFIEGRKEWCISIAIVEDGYPIEAILHCPAANRTFMATVGNGIRFEGDAPKVRPVAERPLVTGSKKLIETMNAMKDAPFECEPFVPSLAYRIALVAIGELDGAFARPGASEWDIAAADLILSEAGGKITDKDGSMLMYNKENVKMPALIASTKRAHDNILYLANTSGIVK